MDTITMATKMNILKNTAIRKNLENTKGLVLLPKTIPISNNMIPRITKKTLIPCNAQ
jgi:hypothetical protein